MHSLVKLFTITFFLFMCSAEESTKVSDWCGLENCLGKRHIDCDNAQALVSASCPKGTVALDLPEVFQKIVSKHNKLRNILAGGGIKNLESAVRMATMRWSSTLAKLAEKNVLLCILEHDACRNTPKPHFVGQSMGLYSYSKGMKYLHINMIHSIIDFWWNEHKHCTMEHIISFPNSMENNTVIRHFTQMVNERATKIGCACAEMRLPRITNFRIVCNYSHDNVKSMLIYTPGPPASRCKNGPNSEYPNLCDIDEEYPPIIDEINMRIVED